MDKTRATKNVTAKGTGISRISGKYWFDSIFEYILRTNVYKTWLP